MPIKESLSMLTRHPNYYPDFRCLGGTLSLIHISEPTRH